MGQYWRLLASAYFPRSRGRLRMSGPYCLANTVSECRFFLIPACPGAVCCGHISTACSLWMIAIRSRLSPVSTVSHASVAE